MPTFRRRADRERRSELNVLFVVSSTQRRGAEVFAVALATTLDDKQFRSKVVALEQSTADRPFDIDVVGGSRWNPLSLVRLARRARHHDVIVSNGGTTLIPVAIAALLSRTPFVYRNIGDPTVWGAAKFANARIGVPLRAAAAIAALYPVAADEITTRYNVDRGKIRIISNAAPSEAFRPIDDAQRTVLRDELELDDRSWIAYVGALSREKQPLLAIQAIAEEPQLGLVIAGDGPLMDECRSCADTAPEGAIRFLGAISDVARVYGAVDAVVIPSRTEGIPGAAIEAGMSGLPVVATDVGGMAHVIVDGETGRVLSDPSPRELADALVDVTRRRTSLGAAAAIHCHEHFSMSHIADQWADLLFDVASGVTSSR